MTKDVKFKIAHVEGQRLLLTAGSFELHPEWGPDKKWSMAEQILAPQRTAALWEALKGYSPALLMKEHAGRTMFGPLDNWEPFDLPVRTGEGLSVVDKEGRVVTKKEYRMKAPGLLVSVRMSEPAYKGIYWCLLAALHPRSGFNCTPSQIADEVLPLAARLGMTAKLQEGLGVALADDTVRLEAPPDDAEEEPAEEPPANGAAERTESGARG